MNNLVSTHDGKRMLNTDGIEQLFDTLQDEDASIIDFINKLLQESN